MKRKPKELIDKMADDIGFDYEDIKPHRGSYFIAYFISLIVAGYLAFLSWVFWFLGWGWLPMAGMMLALVIAYKCYRRI